jgi:hypothetical protein
MSAYIQEGLQPPKTLPHYFENLMLSMATLYQNDTHGLGLEFWGLQPSDGSQGLARTPVAQVRVKFIIILFEAKYFVLFQNILSKFANLTKEVLPSMLYVPYLKFLGSLAKEPRGAQHVFQLLNSSNDMKCTISWTHFYRALKK